MVVVHPPTTQNLSRGLVGHDSASSHHQVCPEGWITMIVYPPTQYSVSRGLVNHNSTSAVTTKSVLRFG